MEVLGYSERGVIGSLFYEMRERKTPELVAELLSLASFPYRDVAFDVRSAKVFIDQSFSNFGTPDALLLVENGGIKQAIFIEAKVKTSQRTRWRIRDEFDAFLGGIEKGEVKSPNLFVQLYFKARLTTALKSGGVKQLQNGVLFPQWCGKATTAFRRIGSNPVVLRAVRMLEEYCGDTLFVALLPEEERNLHVFYRAVLREYDLGPFEEWETRNWGYLTWRQVEDFCRAHHLPETVKVFEFNEGQIY